MRAKKVWKSMIWYDAFFAFLLVVGLVKGGEMLFAYYIFGLSVTMTVVAYFVDVYVERKKKLSHNE